MAVEDLEQFVLSIYDVGDQLKRWVYGRSAEAFAAGDRARDEIASIEQLKQRQADMREKLLSALGGLPASDHPLNARTTGTVACDGYRIDKVIFESRPSTYVTCSLYRPDDAQGPTPAVLFLCGHAVEGKQAPRYQHVCQRLAEQGLIVLAVDPVGQGERLSYYDPVTGTTPVRACTEEHDHVGNQCLPLGDGLARYFIHDAMRAVDYLCSLPEVDAGRIGVTGNSGGGLQTAMMMLCEPRLAAAAPGTFIMNRESYLYSGQGQDAEQVWMGMTKAGLDHEDLVLAMAPRPVLVLAAQADFFPIEGTRRTVARTARFWEMFGVANMPALAEDRIVHQYSPNLAEASAAFFAEHLLGQPLRPRPEGANGPLELGKLNATVGGQVRSDYPEARSVFEENGDRLEQVERRRAEAAEEQRREAALAWLRDRVCRGRTEPSLNPRYLPLPDTEGLTVESNLWWSQEGIFNHGFVFRDPALGDRLPLTIALWEHGTKELRDRMEWIRGECSRGRAVLVLDVTGDGVCRPHAIGPTSIWSRFGTLYKLTTDLFWLGDSLAAVRTYDVLRAMRLAEELPYCVSEGVELYASGRFALYAELAAALDDSFAAVSIEDGPHSVADWVRTRLYKAHDTVSTILPGMLEHFDLPDLRRWREQGK